MFSFACRCNSLTQDLALSNEDCASVSLCVLSVDSGETDSLSDIVDDDGAVGVSVVHGSQRFISLLTGGVPYLELDGRVLIQRYCLSQESCTDCGFSIVVELVLDEPEY
jgi:hypothetical protein